MDIKIESGSMMRIKSNPRINSFRMMVSPPRKAAGRRKRGRSAVAAPRRTAQADRTDFDIRAANGMVKEPIIGTKTVRSVNVSTFILKAKYIFFRREMSIP
jgi:hypothetical protein